MPKTLVTYLGNNPLSPFIFDINVTDTEYDYNANIHIKPKNNAFLQECSKKIDIPYYKSYACGCSDCADSCSVPIQPSNLEICKVGYLNCLDFVCILLFSVLAVAFLTFIIVFSCVYKNRTFRFKFKMHSGI
jgi:hypothetical protein